MIFCKLVVSHLGICFTSFFWISYALNSNMDAFLGVKRVEINSWQITKSVSSLSECAMFCSMETTCCRSSFNAITNECHMTTNCSMGLGMSNDGTMIQKVNSSEIRTCKDGWTNIGQTCYFFSNGVLTWEDAKMDCLLRGGYLAEVTTYNEMNFLRETVMSLQTDFYIGGSDIEEEGYFVWETSKDPVTVEDWYEGQPDNQYRAQDCIRIVHIRKEQGWDDTYCTTARKYLCKEPAT